MRHVKMDFSFALSSCIAPITFVTAIHAKLCINRILHSAVATLNREFATRHCNEQSAGLFDDTDVMHNEFVVDNNRTIGSKTIFAALTKIHLDFGNSHCNSPVVYLSRRDPTRYGRKRIPSLTASVYDTIRNN